MKEKEMKNIIKKSDFYFTKYCSRKSNADLKANWKLIDHNVSQIL